MATLDWIDKPQAHFQEVSFVFRCIQKPTGYLTFWPAQIECRQANGTTRGGWHFGPQHSPNAANATKTAVNFGGYDNLIPETIPGVSADNVFRGSYPTLPGSDPASPEYEWVADTDYEFRCFVSPKQNYTQAELYPNRPIGHFQAPNGEGGDQRAQDIAVRCTVKNLATGVVTVIRDIIIPEAHTTAMMFGGKVWDEDFQPKPIATDQWDVRWSEFRVDKRLVTRVTCQVSGAGHTNQNFFIDKNGFRDKNVVTREVVDNQVFDLPGVAVRAVSVYAIGNKAARDTLVFPVDSTLAVGELVVALVSTDLGHTPSASNWLVLPSFDGLSDVRQTWMFRRHDGSSEYTITLNGGNTNNGAGILIQLYGADSISTPRVGTPTVNDPILGNDTTTNWGVAALEKNTNYGKVLLGISGSPTNGTARPEYPGGIDEIGYSGDDDPWWMQATVAQETSTSSTGPAIARTGTIEDGAHRRNVASYLVIDPQLQRLRPSSDVSSSGVTGFPAGGTLASKIDDTAPDHGDYIELVNGGVYVCMLETGTFLDPNTDEGKRVRYYFTREDASSASFLIELLQGVSTVIASKTQSVAAGTSFLEGTLELTTVEAAAITYHSTTKIPDPALRLRISATVT